MNELVFVLACDMMNALKKSEGGHLHQGVQHKITSLKYTLRVIHSEGFQRAGCQKRQSHTGLAILSGRSMGGAQMRLLGICRAAEHLADPLDDGVPVNAVDLEQLMRFSAARNVRHGQTVHSKAGLVHHGRGHCLT